jgi:hypothetical protein
MRRIFPIAALLLPLAAAAAEPAAKRPPDRADTPRPLGTFEAWTAATHHEADQLVCYAFTRVHGSSAKLAGRGDVILSVTERPSGRDAVALSAGYAYPPSAEARLQVEKASFVLYTSQRSAFARDGHAVVAALLKSHAREIQTHAPAPRHMQVTDQFSLRGFAQAYAAITKACPAK